MSEYANTTYEHRQIILAMFSSSPPSIEKVKTVHRIQISIFVWFVATVLSSECTNAFQYVHLLGVAPRYRQRQHCDLAQQRAVRFYMNTVQTETNQADATSPMQAKQNETIDKDVLSPVPAFNLDTELVSDDDLLCVKGICAPEDIETTPLTFVELTTLTVEALTPPTLEEAVSTLEDLTTFTPDLAASVIPTSLEEVGEEVQPTLVESVLSTYWGPRILLAGACVIYGLNFALLSFMNQQLPPSAVAADRFFLAALVLFPYALRLDSRLAVPALGSGMLCSIAVISQSISLNMGTRASTVAFLAAFAVVICPFLESVVKNKPMSLRAAPQTWLSIILCLAGVGVLEVYEPSTNTWGFDDVGIGDFWALIQAVGFGTCWVLTEDLVREDTDQVLPVTAIQVASMAFFSLIWAVWDNSLDYGLLNLVSDPSLKTALQIIAWTGIVQVFYVR